MGVLLLGRGDLHLPTEQEADEQHQQQGKEAGRQHMSDPLHQLAGGHAQPQRHEEEHQRVDDPPEHRVRPCRKIGRHRHFKGHGGGSGNAQPRADGQINQHGEQQPEGFPHGVAQLVQPVKPGDYHHAQHRQHHGGQQKAQHGRQGAASRVLSQKGWKNQVPRPEEQGKQHKADDEHFGF